MFIENKEELSSTTARAQVLEMLEAGIMAVNPRELIRKALRYNNNTNSLVVQNKTYDIISGRVFVVGRGKAAGYMA